MQSAVELYLITNDTPGLPAYFRRNLQISVNKGFCMFDKTYRPMLRGCVGHMEACLRQGRLLFASLFGNLPAVGKCISLTTATRLNRQHVFVSLELQTVVPKARMTRATLTDLSNKTSISIYGQFFLYPNAAGRCVV